MFALTDQTIQPDSLRATFSSADCGGFVSFEGWVRNWNKGPRVRSLTYEAYEELALREGQQVLEEAYRQFSVRKLIAVHRVGHLKLTEIAVWVGSAGKHRDEAFAACRYAIDEIKTRVPIWKKEYYEDGESEWVGCEHCAKHTIIA
ncbi:MAG: molybdenum cofactor biosynthesis protein MoaE [Opitutales bacterium]